MRYQYIPPIIIRKMYHNFIWQSSVHKILLTFDDGPDPLSTELILKTLSDLKIKGLFFCSGKNIQNFSSQAKMIIDEGHLIGNHSFYHKDLRYLTKSEIVDEIQSTNRIIKDRLNYNVEYFRPPFGRFPLNFSHAMSGLKMKVVMWSLLTMDYKNDLKYVKFATEKYLKQNSIIVLHDSQKSMKIIFEGIKFIADFASKKGYVFGEPEECLK